MKKINIIKSNENSISFLGNCEVFEIPKYKLWLNYNFNIVNLENNLVEVIDERINNPEYLFRIKKSVLKRFKNIEIEFDKSFTESTDNYNQSEINFKEFSSKALRIWNNNFNSDEFKVYCNYLKREFPRQLYHRQLLSSYHLSFSQNAANFSVPGAGKTSIVYAAFSFLNSLDFKNDKHVNKIIVVGPHASFDPWEDEFEKCFEEKVVSYRLNGENKLDDRIDFLKNNLDNQTKLILITYESVPILIDYLTEFCEFSNNKIMLVCDEAHKIKSLEGSRAACVLELSNYVNSRVILTGTPCPNGPQDLFNLFKFLYPKRNVLGFRASALASFNQPGNFHKLQQLIENIKPYFIRITKNDLNLPKVTTDSVINIKLSDFEQKIYNQIFSVMESERSDINKISLHFRLIQSALNIHLLKNNISVNEFNYIENESLLNIRKVLGNDLHSQLLELDENFIPSKHLEVLKIVKSLKEKKQKVVIWGVYIDSIKRLNKLLKSEGLNGEIIIGETKKGKDENDENINLKNDLTRSKIIRKFKSFEKDSYDYIITNPIVLGESISLHKYCHNSIYFELSYAAAPYVQSRDRIHRVWMKDGKQITYETNYYHIISSGLIRNIDELVFSRVERKWKEMENMIEHDIPLFQENLDQDVKSVITELINEYKNN